MTDDKIGLCANCQHSKIIHSDRGSLFYQCQVHFTDPRFPKYPPLPVRTCAAYENKKGETRRN
jgi:hypothetical protein